MKVPEVRLPGWKRPDGLSGWQRIAVVVGLAVLLLAPMSVAATARVSASSGRILAGVTVAGVYVGGMTRDQAVAAVKATTEPKLRRSARGRRKSPPRGGASAAGWGGGGGGGGGGPPRPASGTAPRSSRPSTRP